MDPMIHANLSVLAHRALLLERMATGLANQASALKRDGLPDEALAAQVTVRDLSESEMADLRQARALVLRIANRMKRECMKLCKGSPAHEYVESTHGLSVAVFVFLGCVPNLADFGGVAKLWKWCGLAPGQKRQKGQKAGFSPQMKAHAIMRLAEPCIKHRASPFRPLYDYRRAHTAVEHPDWSDGHSHNDARRYVAKAILKDLWRVSNGMAPKVGGHTTNDAHRSFAPDPDANREDAA